MRQLFKSKPILCFILLTFGLTFMFWFLPVIVSLPKDIGFAAILIGGCGPLIASFLITHIISEEKIKINSKPIFITVFLIGAIVLFLRLYFVNNGLSDANGIMPSLNEVGFFGYVLFGILFFILAINLSNATNSKLKENYLRSSFLENGKSKWYIIGFSLFIILNLGSYYIGSFLGMKTTDFLIKIDSLWLIGFFSNLLFFGGVEEFGFRGLLQKELQKKYNPLIGTFIISFLWSMWFLPLHYNGLYSTSGFIDLLPRFVWQIPITIVFTWLYNKSSYSILAVMLMHAMLNNASGVFGRSAMIYTVLGILFAIYCIIDDKMWKKKPYHLIYENNEAE
ncbi:CPBP family intramembrane metalloprotease [Maribacter litopenaei]|uniref:CPBP family intramembrane metalloprotease n=1 Tax=Maribacter litopenaei TaxID=2976127 RepID=A0ABY5Y5A7_9FLAO|nr:CPBP family intramembrane glutamic endopeptidase [Maribacter litopenaei]UWX54222.1 CPBP family intramembrane metalloprotease [Maribacter litopenaei]